jgi:hypothetical protein
MGATAADLFLERQNRPDRALDLEVPGMVPIDFSRGSDFEDVHTSREFNATDVLGGHLCISGNILVSDARPDTLKALIDLTIKYGVYA